MKIRFMGTGTSQGVPMIGCACSVCASTNPKNRRYRTHVHVEMGGLNIQVDAAPEFRLQALAFKIPKIDLALLTHGHADHIQGCDDLRQYCDMRKGEAIPIYSNEEGIRRLKAIYPYAIRDKAEFKGYPAFSPQPMPVVLDLKNAGKVYSTKQSHGRFDTLGLVFEEGDTGKRIAYYTDCDSVSSEAVELAQGADILVIDALRPQPHPSHLTIEQAVQAAQRIKAKRSYLIHMTHFVEHEKTTAELPGDIALSYDGMLLEL